jgi:hypothetical protein
MTFLDSPQKRISAVILAAAAAFLLFDFASYLLRYSFAPSKYASYYLSCIVGDDVRDVCRDRAGYLRIVLAVLALSGLGLFWNHTFGRIAVAISRFFLWIRTGR